VWVWLVMLVVMLMIELIYFMMGEVVLFGLVWMVVLCVFIYC